MPESYLFSYFLYLSILLVVGASAYVATRGNTAYLRLNARIVCFCAMFIPAVLRYGIGRDYMTYVRVFNRQETSEAAYNLIIWLGHRLDLSSWWFFFCAALLTYFPLCFFVPRRFVFVTHTFFILLVCYLSSWNLTRQISATAFILCGRLYCKALNAAREFVRALFVLKPKV